MYDTKSANRSDQPGESERSPGPARHTAARDTSGLDHIAAQARRIERIELRVVYFFYLCLFVLLATYFYVLPEIQTLTHLEATPRGSLDVPVAEGLSLADVANGLWRHLTKIIHPLANPLIRFFLVTSLAGLVLDRLIRARQRHRECA